MFLPTRTHTAQTADPRLHVDGGDIVHGFKHAQYGFVLTMGPPILVRAILTVPLCSCGPSSEVANT